MSKIFSIFIAENISLFIILTLYLTINLFFSISDKTNNIYLILSLIIVTFLLFIIGFIYRNYIIIIAVI